MAHPPIITLTTDFGRSDHFVGAMKGVILSTNPQASIVDIAHEVQPYDVLDGALTIAQAYPYFPPASVHIVVVDPGVGSPRRPILVSADRHYFVAPDNGVLSIVFERDPTATVRHITSEHYFLQPVSNTFHGRDIFAPVAGHLSKGIDTSNFGEPVTDFVRFALPKPKRVGEKQIKGVILKVDHFGNCLTNITPADIPELFAGSSVAFRLIAGQKEITKLVSSYANGPADQPFVIVGSSAYLELATNRADASQLLGLRRGSEVTLSLE